MAEEVATNAAELTKQLLVEARKLAGSGDSDIMDGCLQMAGLAAVYWKSISPVGKRPHDPHPGTYRDSIVVERKGNKVYVVAKDPKANLIEYGSLHNSPFAPRARTAAYFQNVEGVKVSVVTSQKGPSAAFKRVMGYYPSVPVSRPSPRRRPKK